MHKVITLAVLCCLVALSLPQPAFPADGPSAQADTIQAHHQYSCDVDPSNCNCTFVGGGSYQCTDGEGCYSCVVVTGTLECTYCYQICDLWSPGMGCFGSYHWNSASCQSLCGGG